MTTTHEHEYVDDIRPDWKGYVCRVTGCGFRIPRVFANFRAVRERIVKETK